MANHSQARRLTPEQIDTILAARGTGRSMADVAREIDCSPPAVRYHWHKAEHGVAPKRNKNSGTRRWEMRSSTQKRTFGRREANQIRRHHRDSELPIEVIAQQHETSLKVMRELLHCTGPYEGDTPLPRRKIWREVTDEMVETIRASNEPATWLAPRLGIPVSTIYKIRNRKGRWAPPKPTCEELEARVSQMLTEGANAAQIVACVQGQPIPMF